MSTFVTSIDDIYADSNDRRATMIQLAAGSSLSDLDAASNIDEGSLQILAVYLSNFYSPFLTVLDGDYDNNSDESTGNDDYLEESAKALRKLGMDSESAEFLAEYVLEESLNTCSPLYMKETDFDILWDVYFDNENRLCDLLNVSDGHGYEFRYDDKSGYLKYIKSSTSNMGYKSVNGVNYIQVTYPIFLCAMSYGFTFASVYTGDSDYDTYDISSRDGCTSSDGKEVARMNFYFINNTGTPKIVFSNSEECIQAFLSVYSGLNLNEGVGSALFSITSDEIEAVKKVSDLNRTWVCGWKMYVNWEGTLVADAANYQTPVIPGCVNPHMFTSIEDSADNAAAVPLSNFWGITEALYHYNEDNETLEFYMGDNSIFALDDWRVELGSDGTVKIDAAPFNDSLKDTLEDFAKSSSLMFFDPKGWNNDDNPRFFKGHPFISRDSNAVAGYNYSIAKNGKIDTDGNVAYRAHYDSTENEDYYSLGIKKDYGPVTLLDDIVYYDSFSGINSNSDLSTLFHSIGLIDKTGDGCDTFISKVAAINNTYATFSGLNELGNTNSDLLSVGEALLQPLYMTYVFAYYNKDAISYDASTNIVDLKMNTGNFPSYNESIDWSALETSNLQLKTLTFVYYLLHPTQGIGYVATLFKNKVGGVLLGWHEDVVGSSDSNATTGMTKYLGTSSYVTVPSLYDVEWIANILDMYNSIIVYLIILMSLILLCYVLSGSMTLQRGIIGLACFSLIAFIPPLAINATVNIINTTSDAIYSKKFDYWAICQMELFLQQMDDAKSALAEGDMSSYAAFVISYQSSVSSGMGGDSETFYSGVKLKWMAPKKYSSTAQLANLINSTIDTSTASFAWNLLINSISSVTSGETYLDSPDALYLYRDYTDIYRYASVGYNVVSTFNISNTLNTEPGTDTSKFSASGNHLVMYYNSKSLNSVYLGWNNGMTIPDTYSYDIKKYVLANTAEGYYGKTGDGDTTDNVYDGSSSLKAVKLGFLLNTCNYKDSNSENNYYYSVAKTRNTLATSYLMSYCSTIQEASNSYKKLQLVADGTKEINLDKSSLKNSLIDYNSSSGYFNLGLVYGQTENTVNSYLYGLNSILGLDTQTYDSSDSSIYYNQLSDFFYGLYSESPFYYFNFNIRDQLVSASQGGGTLSTSVYKSKLDYKYDYDNLVSATASSGSSDDDSDTVTSISLSNVAKLFLNNNQYYFYNLTDNSGSGYGELRDFMNMHDLFYYIIPSLRDGVEAARLYDDLFGLYEDEDCSLIFNDAGTFSYDGENYVSLKAFQTKFDSLNEEQKYKFWHSYNTHTILLEYTAWLDAMMDCDYADSETITVMGEKFIVEEPLNPYSYYTCDSNGKMTAGRYMVFSRSEMEYYGLTTADLTTVERKIIELQDNVYEAAIELMNYSALSDETLIQAYAMLQTFDEKRLLLQDNYMVVLFLLPHTPSHLPHAGFWSGVSVTLCHSGQKRAEIGARFVTPFYGCLTTFYLYA